MKRILMAFWLCASMLDAQTFTDDLANKRAVLVWYMRDLGPLPPDNWLAAPMIYAVNGETVGAEPTYHATGNFAYGGNNGTAYYYFYAGTGAWTATYAGKAASGLMFEDFGLHEAQIQPYPTYYHFAMDSASYNVAGLKYNGLFIGSGVDSSGYLIGYTITPGQSFFTGWQYNVATTFDLLQNTETPSFKVVGYYFGLYPNYPPDAFMPAPQNTLAQSSGALLANGVGMTNLLIGWAQEGVYRPSFALQSGYSSPRLYTYMQQYFDGPWKADAASGAVARLSATNWNGTGKINTNTATRTGSLSPTGYFIPTQPGKQVITTRPLENGFYGEMPFYALQMLVDKNRDGSLTSNDVTTAASPHVFWLNNDCDRSTYSSDDLWDEEDVQITGSLTNDTQFVVSKGRIPSLRDLEDYDRLHIRGLKELCRDLPTGQGYSVVLRWKSIQSGSPGIYVFKSADTNGNSGYLTDTNIAAAQIYPTLYPTNYTEPGASSLAVGRVESGISATLHNDSYRMTNDFFVYCGTSRGAGQLAASVYKGTNLVGETSVFLDLRDVKELYERWTLGDGKGTDPNTSPVVVSTDLPTGLSPTQFSDSSSSGRDYILFVHGWNMSRFDKDAFAETAFKRLYWQGYTNRFGMLRWPTDYDFKDKFTDLTFDARNFDNSEFIAWRSGEGLRQLLVSLNQRYPGKVNMMAHSMGNIVAGEALALQAEKFAPTPIVKTYVASQAAVTVHCYDGLNFTPSAIISFDYDHPSVPGSVFNYGPTTPNIYPDWLSTNRVTVERRVNFYNTNDYALAMPVWGFNQLLKPDTGWSDTIYGYMGFLNQSIPFVFVGGFTIPTFNIPSPARHTGSPPFFRVRPGAFFAQTIYSPFPTFLDFEYNLTDMYKTMAYAAEARAVALGAIGDLAATESVINLQTIWGTDAFPDDQGRLFARHKWHSAEFRQNNLSQAAYWGALLDRRGFIIFDR